MCVWGGEAGKAKLNSETVPQALKEAGDNPGIQRGDWIPGNGFSRMPEWNCFLRGPEALLRLALVSKI